MSKREHLTDPPTMTAQDHIDRIKPLLVDAENAYAFALAAGDFDACSRHKTEVAKYRNAIGKLVKQKLAAR
jgi:hypothetical protein